MNAADPIASAIAAAAATPEQPMTLTSTLPLPTGRLVAVQYPVDATAEELMYLAAWVLLEAPKEIEKHAAGRPRLLVPRR